MRTRVAIVAMAVGLAWPGVALGAGGPVPPVQGAGNGISVAGSPYQYVALAAGRSTVVQQLKRTGPVRSSIRVPGQYGIPGVGYNGQTTGLSADGGTLVLADLPGNSTPRTTRLIVVGAPDLTRARANRAARLVHRRRDLADRALPVPRSTIRRLTSASTRYAPTTSRTTACSPRRSSTRTTAARR